MHTWSKQNTTAEAQTQQDLSTDIMSDAYADSHGQPNMRVYDLSGNEIFSEDVEETISGRGVKRRIQEHTALPRFQQKLLHNGTIVGDTDYVVPPADVQLIKIGLLPCRPRASQDMLKAARRECSAPLEELLLKPDNPNCGLASTTPLLAAARAGRNRNVALLLEARADPNNWPNDKICIDAARSGKHELVSLLIAARCDLEARRENGTTALAAAAGSGHVDIVADLLLARADIDAKDHRGTTPLLAAARAGRNRNVALLLEARADLNNWPNDKICIDAARSGKHELVSLLIAARCDMEARNENGTTALAAAARSGHVDIVAELLLARADIHAENHRGRQPLALAAWGGHGDVVQQLLQSRCDPATAEPGPLVHMPDSEAKELFIDALAARLQHI